MIDFKDSQFEREIILWAVRWYVAYPISYRQLEEMMSERGVAVNAKRRGLRQRSARACTVAGRKGRRKSRPRGCSSYERVASLRQKSRRHWAFILAPSSGIWQRRVRRLLGSSEARV